MVASGPSLRLPAVLAAALRVAWLDGVAEQREPCGYLIGGVAPDGSLEIVRAPTGVNVDPEPARAFRLAPEEHLAMRREARQVGARVLGLWHGHLVGDARPSRADADGLGPLGPQVALILGADADDPPRLAAWRRVEGASGWEELPVAIVD